MTTNPPRLDSLQRRMNQDVALSSDDKATRLLPIAGIRRDGGTQPRGGLNEATVQRYVDDLNAGAKFPPVDVVFDDKDYWLWDGFHRIEAHLRAQRTEILVIQRKGTLKDAQWNSFGANKDHGLPRTNEEKERAIRLALQHPNADGMTAVALARHLGVSDKTVTKYREQMQAVSEIPTLNAREGADGKQYPAKRPKPASPPSPTTRSLSDEETRHLVWRTIKAENEIAPGASSLFKWRKYLEWLGKHGEARHYTIGLAAGVRIDAITLAATIAAVATEISNNMAAVRVNEVQAVVEDLSEPAYDMATHERSDLIEADGRIDPIALPADLVKLGWEVRLMPATGRFWCHNRTGSRATGVFDTASEAIAAAVRIQAESKPSPLPPPPPEPPAITGASLVDRLTNAIGQARFFLTNSFAADYERLTDDYETVDEIDGLLKFMERAIKEAVYKGHDRRAK